VAQNVLRVTADNPSVMTYHGTNTYLIDTDEGVYVLDPGPASDQSHLKWLVEYLGGIAAGIILSHHHSDHFGLVPQLKAELDVPVFAYEIFADDTFRPDVGLKDGDVVAGMKVLHTPGHASDHLCFSMDNGVLFSGDHVMGWNSSIVSPPDGDMTAYFAQLQRLLERSDTLYLAGHGPSVTDPLPYVRQLLNHRVRREQGIIEALQSGAITSKELASKLYHKTDPNLAEAALRNVEAHLLKLKSDVIAKQNAAGGWMLAGNL
tara:strand:+ start:4781 stop:5566 length:786 start_codon:yes stop_codon:yes gene_type:complete